MITKWKIDLAYSQIKFKVKHLMITTVTGHFTSHNLLVETEDSDFMKATKFEFTADVNPVCTGNERRDGHLKSAEFFDAAKYPVIAFKSARFEQSGNVHQLHGELITKCVTKPLKLTVEYGGMVVDPYCQTKAGLSATGKSSRKEFGLTWMQLQKQAALFPVTKSSSAARHN